MRRGSIALDTAVVALACGAAATLPSHAEEATVAKACPADDSGLTLSPGFCANVFADGIGHVRHMTVAPNGVLYVNTWSGKYYGNDTPPAGGFLVALQDSQGFGRADTIRRFGETVKTGGAGGTGIALYKGYLYAEINDRIVRYALPESGLAPQGSPETIVSGLPIDGEHPMHPFAIDAAGMLYVDVASATNTCQKANRELESPGLTPCKELETRGGIWRFDANETGQRFSPASRYVTGIRNAGAIAVDATDAVYATQHGRDQLAENWPNLYTPEQGATLPAEEMMRIEKDGVYGWPHCYFDPGQGKLVLAPEYGGDGGKAVGLCAKRRAPIAVFPAHWAPNALLFYQGSQFPARYREGAFIAFHGSWNRAPFEQGGYNVVFQPMKDGKAAPGCEIFADGFAGAVKTPEGAAYRPAGLAVGPDGTLYISDDVKGRIYRVVHRGDVKNASASPVACPSASAPPVRAAASGDSTAGTDLVVPPGSSQEMVALGQRFYHAQGAMTTCTGCHGVNGVGTPLGPDLTDTQWTWNDGSVAGIAKTIREGVARPEGYRNPMPAMGGVDLTQEQIEALAAYVWALSHSR
jgi:glucose/arabinose dehydrogenase/cytochrome c5